MNDVVRQFGFLQKPDERDQLFSVAPMLMETPFITEKYWWADGWWGDQGSSSQCFLPDALVTMADGTQQKIKDIKIGDAVITHLGNVKKVTHLKINDHDGNILGIKYKLNNRKIFCTENHPFYVSKISEQWTPSKPNYGKLEIKDTGWVHAKNLKNNRYYLRQHVQLGNNSINVKDGYELTEEFGRFIGLFLAEGHTYERNNCIYFSFNINEVEYQDFILKYAKDTFNINGFKQNSIERNTCIVTLYNKKNDSLLQFLNDFCKKGCANKQLPNDYINYNKDFLSGLIRGFTEGDGNYGDKRTTLTTVSYELAYQLYRIILNLGINCSIRSDTPIGKREAYRIVIHNVGKTNRRIKDNKFLLSEVERIELLQYVGKVYNLEVEDDESYLVDDIAVHNCVAYSWSHWIEDGPVVQDGLSPSRIKPLFNPAKLYVACQERDEWPGVGNYNGTSVRAAAKILKELGVIKEYRWANNVTEVANTLLNLGPMVVGTKWYEGMNKPNADGYILATGANQGGHAYVLNGVNTVKKVFRIKNSWGKCYDNETEILTQNGWKYFSDISDDEIVATLNPDTHELEYHKIIEKYVYDYSGEMYNYKSASVDLSVTPNHKLYIRDRSTKTWKLEEAQNIKLKHFGMKKDAKWNGTHVETYKIENVEINMNDWVEFLGYFISEGHTSSSTSIRKERVRTRKKINNDSGIAHTTYHEKGGYNHTNYMTVITQLKPENIEKIDICLKKLPFTFCRHDDSGTWSCNNKKLYLELKKIGKSSEKYVPYYIKQLSTEQLLKFYNAIMLGDGSIKTSTNGSIKRTYYTSSKQLANDMQEILLKIGYAGDVHITDRRNKTKRGYKYNYLEYAVRIKHHSLSPDPGVGFVPVITKYDDKVYCVNVENHIVYVRRNGKAVWCGNSWGKSGHAFIKFSDFEKVLSDSSSAACIAFENKVKTIPLLENLSPPTSA